MALDGFCLCFQVKKKPETSYKFDFHIPVYVTSCIINIVLSFKNFPLESLEFCCNCKCKFHESDGGALRTHVLISVVRAALGSDRVPVS